VVQSLCSGVAPAALKVIHLAAVKLIHQGVAA
jgi:hypothetical protein